VKSREAILDPEACRRRIAAEQAAGRSVVLCHGCFDLVHPGHVRHLQEARATGDRLVVSISGDRVVRGKGADRPLIPQELRAENLAALDCVDWVVISPEATAVEILDRLRPDIYVKGREYAENRDPRFAAEQHLVESYGGRVVFTSGDVVFSSTALIDAATAAADPVTRGVRAILERPGCGPEQLETAVDAIRGRRLVVTGETIIDTYIACDRPEIAGEAPVMSLRPIGRREFDGGAAVIARHAAALGARPVLVTPLPRDPVAEALRLRLELEGVEVRPIDVSGRVPEKQRFLVGHQKVMKLDPERGIVVDEAARRAAVAASLAAAEDADAAIVCDFGAGFFTAPMMETLTRGLADRVGVVAGDVSGRRSHLQAMRRMDLLTPSEVEIRDARHDWNDGIPAVVDRLLQATESRAAIVTLAGEGCLLFEAETGAGDPGAADPGRSALDGHFRPRLAATHIPALAAQVVDPLGCGDALLATATLTLATGATATAAMAIGSIAAATHAGRLGNPTVDASDLRRGIVRLAGARMRLADPGAPLMETRAG
jgi:rfaE bifunctional protein nucleotidyltransferase chain/domain